MCWWIFLWWSFCNIYKYQINMWYTWDKYDSYMLIMSQWKEISSFTNFQVCHVVLLTTVTRLYLRSAEFTHLIAASLCLLPPSHFFHLPAPVTNSLLFVSIWGRLFLDSTCGILLYLFFTVWLITLSTVPSSFIHIVANGRISFFKWLILHCIYMYAYHILFLRSLADGQRLFLYLGYCKQWCCEHRGVDIAWGSDLISFGYISKSGITW